MDKPDDTPVYASAFRSLHMTNTFSLGSIRAARKHFASGFRGPSGGHFIGMQPKGGGCDAMVVRPSAQVGGGCYARAFRHGPWKGWAGATRWIFGLSPRRGGGATNYPLPHQTLFIIFPRGGPIPSLERSGPPVPFSGNAVDLGAPIWQRE